eukprot:FR744341.1.p3 GENE.FR744341.1~~FR744341.1.p3  ORF type:complete len:117 (+),score=18.80 FR744341.1:613-963(+)
MRAILLSDSAESCRAKSGQERAEAPLDFSPICPPWRWGVFCNQRITPGAAFFRLFSEPKTESAGGKPPQTAPPSVQVSLPMQDMTGRFFLLWTGGENFTKEVAGWLGFSSQKGGEQ